MSCHENSSKSVPADRSWLEQPDIPPPPGSVQLSHKNSPVFELPPPLHNATPWIFSRGKVDVSGIKELLVSGGDRIWSDEEAAATNVALTRPSHDAWGIRKIVFVYCDDFLKRCYELPWFNDPKWSKLLMPIFEALGVSPDKVVRCLLASMPPDLCIPPHHDTGFWVHHTHRIHVPIITEPDSVVFAVGPTVETMKRYRLEEGCIAELNNQAKHAVHNCWDHYRTHLIFDYVEDYPMPRMKLKPGEKLSQTRRTIDLPNDFGSKPCPSFLILGAQKCGTTSMYEYLSQHPLILRARRRETHFFDWRWDSRLRLPKDQVDAYHRNFYKSYLDEHPSLITGESTPSYLLHSDLVIPRVKALAPHVKFVVMLRDPVARAYSQYQMVIDPNGTPEQKKARGTHWLGKTFEQVVEEELEDLKRRDITPETTYQEFKTRYLSSRPMGYGSHSLLGRGLYALQLKPWLEAFGLERIHVAFMEDMKSPQGAKEVVEEVFKFLDVPPHPISDLGAKNARSYGGMSEQTREKLQKFYSPFNQQLLQLIHRETGPQWCTRY